MIPPGDVRPGLSTARLSPALLTVLLGSLQAIMPLSTDLYLPALPTIAHTLGATPGAVQITLAVFLIGVALGQIAYGPLTDKYGRKRPLLMGLLVYVFGSVLCALAPSLGLLITGRVLQAFGASAGAVITAAIVRDLWSGKALAERLSLLMLVIGVAPLLAPSIGGVILATWNWHGLFWFLGAFGLLAALSIVLLPETSAAAERAQTHLRDAPRHYRALLRNTPFLLAVLTNASRGGVLFSYITSSPFLYIQTLGVSPSVFAVLFAVNALGFVASAPINRLLLRRFRMSAIASSAITTGVGVATLLVIVVATGHASVWTLTPLNMALLATVGLISPNMSALAFGHVRERAGSASAVQGSVQIWFSGIAGALVSTLGNGSPLPMVGVTFTFAVLAATFMLLFLRGQRRAALHSTPPSRN